MLLDNQADVSLVRPCFLTDVKELSKPISIVGVSGTKLIVKHSGMLPGFFECLASDEISVNILCLSDVEDLYDISYVRKSALIVHLQGEDMIFDRVDKLYVGKLFRTTPHMLVNFATTKEMSLRYTNSEISRAKMVSEFIESSGYPSETDLIKIVESGNIINLPFTVADVKRHYDIYGAPVGAVRGKKRNQKVSYVEIDPNYKSQRTEQIMYCDIFTAASQKFLISLFEPLMVCMTTKIEKESSDMLGLAIQAHINSARERGFSPVRIHLDPQSGFKALKGQFPGVEVDVCGAGDHLPKVDVRIRMVKEIARSVLSKLPWTLPPEWVDDLITFSVNRLNLKAGRMGLSPQKLPSLEESLNSEESTGCVSENMPKFTIRKWSVG